MSAAHCLLASAALTWIMIMVAAELRTPTWTRAGAKLAFGNREALPEPSALAARADRAAKNMLENMIIFVPVMVAAQMTGADARLGATVFVVARVAYFAVYLIGVKYLRSGLWLVALLGILHVGVAMLRA